MISSLLLAILLVQGTPAAKGGGVAGTLRGTDGKPAAGVRVGVMEEPRAGRGLSGAGTLVHQVRTDASGRFLLEDVTPGRYYIVAADNLTAPTFYPGVREIVAAKTIEVRAMATVRDIDFEILPSYKPAGTTVFFPVVRVTGRIVLRNNPSAPMPQYISLVAQAALPANTGAGAPGNMPMATPVAPDGSFDLTLFDADQRLADVRLPEGYSLVSVTSGGRNLLTQTIAGKAGMELIVSADVGDIRPRYRLVALVREDATDRLLSGETVELVSSSGDVLRLLVNAQGMVTFPQLLPGTYVLRLASAGLSVPEKQVVIRDGSVQVELRATR
jgi:hypothetical protein